MLVGSEPTGGLSVAAAMAGRVGLSSFVPSSAPGESCVGETAVGAESVAEALRNFTRAKTPLGCLAFLRFRGMVFHDSEAAPSTTAVGSSVAACCLAAFSASSCCFRNRSPGARAISRKGTLDHRHFIPHIVTLTQLYLCLFLHFGLVFSFRTKHSVQKVDLILIQTAKLILQSGGLFKGLLFRRLDAPIRQSPTACVEHD